MLHSAKQETALIVANCRKFTPRCAARNVPELCFDAGEQWRRFPDDMTIRQLPPLRLS